MTNDTTLENHISFEYTSFDRVVLRGYIWIFYSFFNSTHIVKPLLSGSYKRGNFPSSDQASIIEGAYTDINKVVSLIMSKYKLVS